VKRARSPGSRKEWAFAAEKSGFASPAGGDAALGKSKPGVKSSSPRQGRFLVGKTWKSTVTLILSCDALGGGKKVREEWGRGEGRGGGSAPNHWCASRRKKKDEADHP